MADITVTAAKVGLVYPAQAETYNVKVAVAVTKGQALYQKTDGTYALADASAVGTAQLRGLALEAGAAGQSVSMLKRGVVSGFTLATYGDFVYLSDTAGALSTTVGTVAVRCGHVFQLNDPSKTEVLYFETDWVNQWS